LKKDQISIWKKMWFSKNRPYYGKPF